MAKKIAIIGAGIAGLSAAIHLQRNEYETELFESHTLPGGLCTAWRKNGYTFDGCIHWLMGSGPAHHLYHAWNEILDMSSLRFVEPESFVRVDDDRGNCLTLYSDADRLAAELGRLAAGGEDSIRELADGIKWLAREHASDPAAKEPVAAFAAKWGPVTVSQFTEGLRSPFLEFALRSLLGEGSILRLPRIHSNFHLKAAGYPIGGSLAFARAIEKRYVELGGKIHYKSRVVEVLCKDDRACGLRLEDGREVAADIVVSAADGRHTVLSLLKGKYLNDTIHGFYADEKPTVVPYASWVQVSLGLKRSFGGIPHQIMFKAPRPLIIDEKSRYEIIGTRIYNSDPTLADPGHTVVIGMWNTVHAEYWQELRNHRREEYQAQKRRVANDFISLLDEKLGDIKDQLEVVDVSTPATAIRYTGNWRGSYMGWGWGNNAPVGTQRQLPGLANFYMTGQWVASSGGLPPAMLDGRQVAVQICENDGKPPVSGKLPALLPFGQ